MVHAYVISYVFYTFHFSFLLVWTVYLLIYALILVYIYGAMGSDSATGPIASATPTCYYWMFTHISGVHFLA